MTDDSELWTGFRAGLYDTEALIFTRWYCGALAFLAILLKLI